MVYTDAHCHLGSREFDADRDAMISRMLAQGVTRAIVICCSRHDLDYGIHLCNAHPGFRLALGIHPQDLEDDHEPERMERFRKIVSDVQPDMIGEIGLDHHSHRHTKAAQNEFFLAQMKLAAQLDLPVDIHCRKAFADTFEILKQFPVHGIIHSYSGSAEMAARFIRLGYSISFGSGILFPNAKKPAEVIASVPLDRLLIETDAPYQSPVRGHRHEPADVLNIYKAVSAIRHIPLEELQAAVEANFDRIFQKTEKIPSSRM